MTTKETIDSLTITPNKHLFLSVTHYGYRGTYYDGFLILKNDDLTHHFPHDQPQQALSAWLTLIGKKDSINTYLSILDSLL